MRRVPVALWRRPVIRLERRSNGTFLRVHTKHDMVLMYTDDVDGVWLSICKRAGWKLQLVDHIFLMLLLQMLLETSGKGFHKMEIQLITESVAGKIP